MKRTIDFRAFKKEFEAFNRSNHFEHGLETLFNYLEEREQEAGVEYELDVIELCCEYQEARLSQVLEDYKLNSREALERNTIVLDTNATETRINEDGEEEEDPIIIFGVF